VPVRLDSLVISAGESIFVKIQHSTEQSFYIAVSKDGRCFMSAPYNTKMKIFELTETELRESSHEERDKALAF
jgi:hypothetical protein